MSPIIPRPTLFMCVCECRRSRSDIAWYLDKEWFFVTLWGDVVVVVVVHIVCKRSSSPRNQETHHLSIHPSTAQSIRQIAKQRAAAAATAVNKATVKSTSSFCALLFGAASPNQPGRPLAACPASSILPHTAMHAAGRWVGRNPNLLEASFLNKARTESSTDRSMWLCFCLHSVRTLDDDMTR